jgi:phosphoribosylformylglycinamidine synthase subunit PurS
MKAKVYITLKKGVLDPQGKTVQKSLASLGFNEATDVRVGKYIEILLPEGTSPEDAKNKVSQMCEKLLANVVIEEYQVEL